ncbi:MAG: M23 family metallopeptidase [Methylococcaceae bacterium]
MKKKFHSFLFIGIGLALAIQPGYAKTTHLLSKKHPTSSIKRAKALSRKQHNHITHTKKKKHSHIASNRTLNKRKQHYIISKHHSEKLINTSSFENKFENQIIQQPETRSLIHSLISSQNQDSFKSASPNSEKPYHLTSTHGVIQSSLHVAGKKAGLSDNLVTQLTNIFAWDIDFATNLHPGDLFTVVYNTSSTGRDEIVAAEFVNQGKILTAIRYKDNEGNVNYYSPEGKTMRKAFLSTPVDYERISSHFDTHRRHPILNRIRAHKGVDYAARTGTQVKAAGDGKITFLGRKGGYGQVMIIKHGEHYETLYAHLSNFKRDLKDGDSVRQGEVIGYVGQTGLATGPHLHYEFRIDGVHSNPEALAKENSLVLNRQLLTDFKSQAQPLLAQLYQTKARTLFAKNLYKND